jgi:hypothetical protein
MAGVRMRRLRRWSTYVLMPVIALSALTAPRDAVAAVSATSTYGISSSPSLVTGQAGVIDDPADSTGVFGLDKVNDIKKVGSDATGMVYAAGVFTRWVARNGTSYVRNNIVGFDPRSGAVLPFAPVVNGEIRSMEPSADGLYMYIGGNFTTVNGVARKYAAKIQLSNGALVTSWDPKPSNKVEDISTLRGHLVLAGYFRYVGSLARVNVASVSTTTGAPDTWFAMNFGGFTKTPTTTMVHKIVANPTNTAAVLIGNFDTVNGVAHRRIAMVNLGSTNASPTSWYTAKTARGTLSSTGYPQTNATNCNAAYSAPEGDVTWTPSGTYFALASTGGRVDAGGICDSASLWRASDINNSAALPVNVNYTGGDTLSGVVCTDQSCFVSGHERWADNPPRLGVACTDVLPPNQGPWAGYDCGGPTSVRRAGMAELSLTSWQATAWNPTRGKEHSMDNVMLLTSEGLWIGSDAMAAGGKTGFNDIVLFPRL